MATQKIVLRRRDLLQASRHRQRCARHLLAGLGAHLGVPHPRVLHARHQLLERRLLVRHPRRLVELRACWRPPTPYIVRFCALTQAVGALKPGIWKH